MSVKRANVVCLFVCLFVYLSLNCILRKRFRRLADKPLILPVPVDYVGSEPIEAELVDENIEWHRGWSVETSARLIVV